MVAKETDLRDCKQDLKPEISAVHTSICMPFVMGCPAYGSSVEKTDPVPLLKISPQTSNKDLN